MKNYDMRRIEALRALGLPITSEQAAAETLFRESVDYREMCGKLCGKIDALRETIRRKNCQLTVLTDHLIALTEKERILTGAELDMRRNL